MTAPAGSLAREGVVTAEHGLALYREMLRIRRFEERKKPSPSA